jgi:hypothetical protein
VFARATSTRFIGWCPVCQRDIKVRDGLLVHHGYRRPGIGYIVGDCPGVGYEPYELGVSACEHYLNDMIVHHVRGLVGYLDTLKSPDGPNTLTFDHYDVTTHRVIYDRTGTPERIRLTRAQAHDLRNQLQPWERDRYDWARRIRIEVAQAERDLKFWDSERVRLENLIANWVPRELRTIEQEIERQESTRQERQAQRSSARDKKIAEEVAKIQKRIDAAVRNKNSATLADIFTSQKLQQVSGWRLSHEQALALLDRDDVWRAFGLFDGDQKEILQAMRYGLKIPSDRPGVRFDYGPLPWPTELGGGTSKTR